MLIDQQTLEDRIRADLVNLRDNEVVELTRMVRGLVERFQPEAIYVFGSQARGTAKPDSDVDLLVVISGSDLPPHQLDQIAYGVLGRHRLPVDVLVMTRAEFDRRLGAYASLPSTVLREGRLLYAA